MRWPVAKPAHISHKIIHAAVLVLLDEIPNCIVEIKRRADGDRSDRDPDEPVKNPRTLHKLVPVNSSNSYSCSCSCSQSTKTEHEQE
jgi:hypothetical protein